jgi:hypothetical protein
MEEEYVIARAIDKRLSLRDIHFVAHLYPVRYYTARMLSLRGTHYAAGIALY